MEKLLEVTNLSYSYGKQQVLQELSFTIAPGEIVGIVGANGCGKSTLLQLLAGALELQGGSIRLQGRDLAGYTAHELAQHLGLMQQELQSYFPYTCREVLLLGRYRFSSWWRQPSQEDEELVATALSYVGLEQYGATPLAELSGGERKRVCLAKLLLQNPSMLLLDEPLNSVDAAFTEEFVELCQSLLAKGRSAVLVLHDLQLVKRLCQRVIVLKDGCLAWQGEASAFEPERLAKQQEPTGAKLAAVSASKLLQNKQKNLLLLERILAE